MTDSMTFSPSPLIGKRGYDHSQADPSLDHENYPNYSFSPYYNTTKRSRFETMSSPITSPTVSTTNNPFETFNNNNNNNNNSLSFAFPPDKIRRTSSPSLSTTRFSSNTLPSTPISSTSTTFNNNFSLAPIIQDYQQKLDNKDKHIQQLEQEKQSLGEENMILKRGIHVLDTKYKELDQQYKQSSQNLHVLQDYSSQQQEMIVLLQQKLTQVLEEYDQLKYQSLIQSNNHHHNNHYPPDIF